MKLYESLFEQIVDLLNEGEELRISKRKVMGDVAVDVTLYDIGVNIQVNQYFNPHKWENFKQMKESAQQTKAEVFINELRNGIDKHHQKLQSQKEQGQ